MFPNDTVRKAKYSPGFRQKDKQIDQPIGTPTVGHAQLYNK